MKIIFRKNEKVVIVSFDTVSENFDSNYERNKFFRELYGWQQVIPGERKNYSYRRPGLLDEIPHKKISSSVFMIALEHMKRMEDFFDQWSQKVEYDMIEVILERERILKDLRRRREEL
ncbi:MAG: hypothetical protein HY831_01495 [Candidatus Aenigmarchaeota archaeon]|nr:hypothetical protein [Candidatus Aenigmarchaeota archaeon]